MNGYHRRIASLIVAMGSALVLTAQVALAGSGTGLIHFPNPTAPFLPGVTDRSFQAEECKRLPQKGAQGWDAWVVSLDSNTNYIVVRALGLPQTNLGYTFHIVFYGGDDKAEPCASPRDPRTAKGNPTPAVATKGADWVVISVFYGTEVEIEWKECGSRDCSF